MGSIVKIFFNKKVRDCRFWIEISKILNSGLISDLKNLFKHKKILQKSVLSPFLFNIYLHELDKKIMFLQKEKKYLYKFHKNNKTKLDCNKLSSNHTNNNLKIILLNYNSKENTLKNRKIDYKKQHKTRKCYTNINFQYIRYVNDFLIGITGNHKYVVQTQKDINIFLRNYL